MRWRILPLLMLFVGLAHFNRISISVVGAERSNVVSRVGLWAGRQLIRSTDVFAIAIKPFMDRFNYDQDRISACCHHLLDTKGNPVSFCEYNARLRPGDSWDSFPLIKEAAAAL